MGAGEARHVVVVNVVVVVGVVPSFPLHTIHRGISLVDRSAVLFLSSMIGARRRIAPHYLVVGFPHS